MAYIAGLIIVIIFFTVLHYFTELTKTQKITVTALTFALILFAIYYNTNNSAKREKMMSVVTSYKQGKEITCNDIKINNKTYSLSIGTFTFIGKEDTSNYGNMISASDCE